MNWTQTPVRIYVQICPIHPQVARLDQGLVLQVDGRVAVVATVRGQMHGIQLVVRFEDIEVAAVVVRNVVAKESPRLFFPPQVLVHLFRVVLPQGCQLGRFVLSDNLLDRKPSVLRQVIKEIVLACSIE